MLGTTVLDRANSPFLVSVMNGVRDLLANKACFIRTMLLQLWSAQKTNLAKIKSCNDVIQYDCSAVFIQKRMPLRFGTGELFRKRALSSAL